MQHSVINNDYIAHLSLCMHEMAIGHLSTSDFLKDTNFGNSRTFKADIVFLIFA